MDFSEISGYVLTALSAGGLTQLINWRINKRKGVAEAKTSEAEAREKEIENMRKAMEDFYAPLVAKQNDLIKKQDDRIAELEAEIQRLRNEKRAEDEAHARQITILQEQIVEISKALGIRAKSVITERKTKFHESSD